MRIYALNHDEINRSLEPELLRSLKPHAAPVVVTTIDSTGTLLATGGADGIAKIWDIKGGFITHTFHAHNGLISALHFFQVESQPRVEESQTNKKRKKPGATEDAPTDHAIAGFRLATGGEDGKVRIWNLQTRKSTTTLESHFSVVRKIDYCPEENALLSASRDKTVIVYDVKSWKVRHTIPVLEELETAGFLVQGRVIYSGGELGNVRLWSMESGKEFTAEQAPKTEMEAIQDSIVCPKIGSLMTIHADQTLVLQSIDSLQVELAIGKTSPLHITRRICGNYDQIVDLAYVGPDRDLLAVNSNSEDIRIISLREQTSTGSDANPAGFFGGEVALLKGHEDIIISMDVDWSGHWIATGAKDNNARLWRVDPENGSYTCYATLTGHAESVAAVALPKSSPPESTAAFSNPLEHPPAFLITASDDKTIKRWDISSASTKAQISRAVYTRKAHEKNINALTVHHSSNLFASASQDKLIKIWSIVDGSTAGVLRGHRRGVWAVSFSPPGTNLTTLGPASSRGYVLTGSGDQTVRIWNLTDYSCLLTLEGHTNSVLKVLWLPSPPTDERGPYDKRGQLVASASADTLVKIWDVSTGECATTLDGHTDRVWTLVSHPPNSPQTSISEALISGGADGVLTFWRDTTAATASAAREKEVERVETDQRLSNLIHANKYRDAIVLALQLDQPLRLLSLFKSVSDADTADRSTYTGNADVDAAIADLADEQIYRLLLRCRDWNTNARNAVVAQRVLRAIVRSYSRDKLASLKAPRGTKAGASVKDILEGMRVWSERHYARITDMWDESFLVEFVLGEMDGLGEVNGHGTAEVRRVTGDVVMSG